MTVSPKGPPVACRGYGDRPVPWEARKGRPRTRHSDSRNNVVPYAHQEMATLGFPSQPCDRAGTKPTAGWRSWQRREPITLRSSVRVRLPLRSEAVTLPTWQRLILWLSTGTQGWLGWGGTRMTNQQSPSPARPRCIVPLASQRDVSRNTDQCCQRDVSRNTDQCCRGSSLAKVRNCGHSDRVKSIDTRLAGETTLAPSRIQSQGPLTKASRTARFR